MSRDETNAKRKNLRAERLAAGLCSECGDRPHRKGKTQCQECSDERKKRQCRQDWHRSQENIGLEVSVWSVTGCAGLEEAIAEAEQGMAETG